MTSSSMVLSSKLMNVVLKRVKMFCLLEGYSMMRNSRYTKECLSSQANSPNGSATDISCSRRCLTASKI